MPDNKRALTPAQSQDQDIAGIISHRPDMVRNVSDLTAVGMTVQDIARALHITARKVISIRRVIADDIDKSKHDLGQRLKTLCVLAMEELQERLLDPDKRAAISNQTLPYLIDRMVTQWLVISGQATSRLEHTTAPQDQSKAFDVWLSKIPSADCKSVNLSAMQTSVTMLDGRNTESVTQDAARDSGAPSTPGSQTTRGRSYGPAPASDSPAQDAQIGQSSTDLQRLTQEPTIDKCGDSAQGVDKQ